MWQSSLKSWFNLDAIDLYSTCGFLFMHEIRQKFGFYKGKKVVMKTSFFVPLLFTETNYFYFSKQRWNQ